MLDVQGPPLMPHAVPFGQPFSNLAARPQPRPISPRSHSLQQPARTASTSGSKPALPIFTRELTPPSEMHVALGRGRSTSQYPASHLDKDASGFGYQPAHATQPYTSPSRPPRHPNGVAKALQNQGNHGSDTVRGNRDTGSKPVDSSVSHASRVPDTVRAPQSGIAQLAAEVTCLFWFEDASTIDRIESLPSPPPPSTVAPLCADAAPSIGFRKWVSTILSTTQVTQNVTLLALMFIWRLKRANPNVKGKPGSEFRLLTVALMLGNKFLDDNTYTNKTWAEVSGISVQEVHIMEVEFLSNMRYSLFTDESEWRRWHVTLGKFGTYLDASTRMSHEQTLRQTTLHTPALQLPVSLPSPPTSHHASPPYVHNVSPSHAARTSTPHLLPRAGSTTVSPIGPLPELNLWPSVRKRSYDEQAEEPPPKRLSRHATQPAEAMHSSSATLQLPNLRAPAQGQRLPLPALKIPNLAGSPNPTPQPGSQLPAAGRAMSMVYPPASQPNNMPPSMPPILPTNNLSPYPVSGTSSPLSATFGPGQNHSPSYFLQQRSSPYRPVRQPHMLLVPPPSVSQSAPRDMPYTHMQYHPLGRQTERRIGHLPYMHHEAWPQTHQFNQWPVHTPQ